MSSEDHGPEDEHQDDGGPDSLEKLRARHRADAEARRQEWLAEHAGDPDDPFGEDELAGIIYDTIDQQIGHLHRPGEDGTWMTVTYLMRPPIKLIDITMGSGETHEPAVSLIISDTEAHDLIALIVAAIGPDTRQQPPRPAQ